ncbi:hypothetical protein B4U80_15045 [Leptotrombidium deliense]|uniref:Uncharacterized protein n=1 Tax=Leptotrombidium deliense TaxID=299467 RepID=A0A443RSH3_9ACAR|nr:hypothetical protein B4U80_15045 [Leptotrombidium deliense]
MSSKEEIESALDKVREEMFRFHSKYNHEVATKMDQLFEYSVHGGKMLRITLLLQLFDEIATKEERTKLRGKAMLLGICVHLLVSAWMVIDDMIDKSETRLLV